MTEPGRFSKLLDGALGDGPPDAALRVQRANVLAAARRGHRPAGRVRWELAAGALATAVAVVALLVFRARAESLSASWHDGLALGPSASVAAGERAEAIDFSDGSRVLLEPKASARLVRLEPKHAEISLAQGELSASVRHRDGVHWSIQAGPYEVRVVGTKFSVAWDRSSLTLKVAVTEGRVRVTGGELGSQPIELTPGERLERRSPPPVVTPAAPSPEARPSDAEPSGLQEVPRASVGTPVPAPTVGELAQAGKYREALALAEQRGFERVVGELPEGELLALGNAARYAGSGARARQAMVALRSRFPGRPASQLAALYLARIAEQLDRNPSDAATWLRVFLSESPTGSLAADARASLLSILLAAGDTAGATLVARDYLRYHPTGPVADRARLLVSRSESK